MPEVPGTLAEELLAWVNNKELSDVTFLLLPPGEDGEQPIRDERHVFYGHRALLASRNAHFKSLFHFWKEEGNPKAGKIDHEEVVIRGIDTDVFAYLLEYL